MASGSSPTRCENLRKAAGGETVINISLLGADLGSIKTELEPLEHVTSIEENFEKVPDDSGALHIKLICRSSKILRMKT